MRLETRRRLGNLSRLYDGRHHFWFRRRFLETSVLDSVNFMYRYRLLAERCLDFGRDILKIPGLSPSAARRPPPLLAAPDIVIDFLPAFETPKSSGPSALHSCETKVLLGIFERTPCLNFADQLFMLLPEACSAPALVAASLPRLAFETLRPSPCLGDRGTACRHPPRAFGALCLEDARGQRRELSLQSEAEVCHGNLVNAVRGKR